MNIEISNASLQSVAEYLPKLKGLTGRENRARQKLLKKVTEKFQEFYSDLQEIKSEHPDDQAKQDEEFSELLKEKATLDMTEYERYMPIMLDTLLDYSHGISTESQPGKPSDAVIHDYLIDVLEEAIDEDEEVDHSNNDLQINNSVEDAKFQEVE